MWENLNFEYFSFVIVTEDTLNQLQNIRESVSQMQQSTPRKHYGNTNLMNPGVSILYLVDLSCKSFCNKFVDSCILQLSSSRLFSSCPSLPDLTAVTVTNSNNMWPNQPCIGFNSDRRKSWTAIEDLTECAKNSHKRFVSFVYLFKF